MIELIGWVSAALLAFCGVPLLVATKLGDKVFLWCWFLGELYGLGYICWTSQALPLLANYGLNTLLVAAILWRRRAP